MNQPVYTAAGWIVVGALAAGSYWYYTKQHPDKRRRATPMKAPSAEVEKVLKRKANAKPEGKTEGKTKQKQKHDDQDSHGPLERSVADVPEAQASSVSEKGTGTAKNRKKDNKKGKGPNETAGSSAPEAASHAKGESTPEGIKDQEFARLLAGAQKGTSLEKPAGLEKKGKQKKKTGTNDGARPDKTKLATTQQAPTAVNETSTEPSLTGTETEDASPEMSPGLPAAAIEDTTGVADMLERPAAGPSVLRLTAPADEQWQSVRTKKQKNAEAIETKKQRQNKAKNEERKAEMAEAESQRRGLLEKQLRTARIAEGRPAKNGEGHAAAPPPLQSAWIGLQKLDKSEGDEVKAEWADQAVGGHARHLLDTLEGDEIARTWHA